MSARDELALDIAKAEYGWSREEWGNRADRSPAKYYTLKYADDLIAAGWLKTRTITTAEELDALPVGSVILDPIGLSLHRNAFTGWCSSNGAKEIPMDMLLHEALPATVLYEPPAA